MSLTISIILAVIAIIIIAGLAFYALKLRREVKVREARREQELIQARANCLESLEAIARAMQAGQVDMVEGGLRCKVLIEILDTRLAEDDVLSVFGVLHGRVSHLHTHSARKELSPRERLAEDKERIAVEEALAESLQLAASRVLSNMEFWHQHYLGRKRPASPADLGQAV
ncbi:DUF2489 domain-containing protein [Cobetia sp. MC34]|uniref:DUF2489 domain-containing protein n=1 Tax=Cobetia sp. MC34 TaxID=2785080 RepID=UPI001BC9128F|nr:DUF2489 domain-containing protein [Cobetia sp. MC34]MBS4153420.1 DUF2489 domain-containing protein [Cobetia sp. MC34]